MEATVEEHSLTLAPKLGARAVAQAALADLDGAIERIATRLFTCRQIETKLDVPGR